MNRDSNFTSTHFLLYILLWLLKKDWANRGKILFELSSNKRIMTQVAIVTIVLLVQVFKIRVIAQKSLNKLFNCRRVRGSVPFACSQLNGGLEFPLARLKFYHR